MLMFVRTILLTALLSLMVCAQSTTENVETISVDRARMLSYLIREAEKLGADADARISTKEKLAA